MVATEPATAQSATTPTLLMQIGRLYFDMMPIFEQYVGMSLARWRVLAQLRSHDQLSQAALQQRIQVDGAAITRQVKQLEEDGLVMRRADPNDNRFTLVSLTPTGRAFAEEVYSKRDVFEAHLTEGLGDEELAVLRRCLQRMDGNLKAFAADLKA